MARKFFIEAKEESQKLGINKGIDKLNVCMAALKKDLVKSHLYNGIFNTP